MKTPHIHAELIKAWADGAEIQVKPHGEVSWRDRSNPSWDEDCDYRIKPEPKPDVSYYVVVEENKRPSSGYMCKQNTGLVNCQQIKLIFDGESGKFKGAVKV